MSSSSEEKPNLSHGHPEPYTVEHETSRTDAIRKIRTAGSISIDAELFERLYLSPKNQVKGQLRSTLGNPTPLGLLGFIMSLTPLSCQLMGWRGSGGGGASIVGVLYSMGGVLMVLGGLLEFVLGNTFPFVVFAGFGGFWLATAISLTPSANASGAFTSSASGTPSPEFYSSYAFFFVFMALLSLIFLVCGIRTNIMFEVVFMTLVLGFTCLAGAYWQLANGNADIATKVQTAAGAFLFVCSMAGWYLFFVQMAASVDLPWNLPVGDLSRIVKGKNDGHDESV
ncbi:GPR1/FUN34/yaaH family-domain-containing protein [Talaromyces proteolyticus]|uniref:GPR1/FUN34/yaaH family-domain-containing protein n=1 Tax=Talaromyces proteolyticus TaxID=1131652 RepID=A0AAD4KF83_9EURO|nr:GPR1/FUN34/yaaH family-domain-containing protein [Talaromyces proteolyticus]KAH8690600.1 GPR1/FUN34/yaaH family-domain-containing protein [Talaromyces proteolyticus]